MGWLSNHQLGYVEAAAGSSWQAVSNATSSPLLSFCSTYYYKIVYKICTHVERDKYKKEEVVLELVQ